MISYDKKNYRKHPENNQKVINGSLVRNGAGRSILLDKDNTIIAGNGVYEQAKKLNIPIRVIQTDGSELIAVQRTDVGQDDANYCGDRKQDDVWEVPRPKRSEEHPTMKPVQLVARAITNSSKYGDIVLDLFGGGGSTLIASEQTKRINYSMELSEKYCDVIVQRWVNLTGGKVILNGQEIEWQITENKQTNV